jgi:hypothetical protein
LICWLRYNFAFQLVRKHSIIDSKITQPALVQFIALASIHSAKAEHSAYRNEITQPALVQFIALASVHSAKAEHFPKIYAQFMVEIDGSITDIVILRGAHPAIDREVKRILRTMPAWKPAELNGKKVRSRFTVPIWVELR